MTELVMPIYVIGSVVLGAVTIWLTRRWLDTKLPLFSSYIAITAAAIVLLVVSNAVGITAATVGNILVASAFVGTQFSYSNPWSTRAVCNSLAVSAGLVLLLALVTQDLVAAALALGAAAILIYVGSTFDNKPSS